MLLIQPSGCHNPINVVVVVVVMYSTQIENAGQYIIAADSLPFTL